MEEHEILYPIGKIFEDALTGEKKVVVGYEDHPMGKIVVLEDVEE